MGATDGPWSGPPRSHDNLSQSSLEKEKNRGEDGWEEHASHE